MGVMAGNRCFDTLLALHADFRVIDDGAPDDLRPETRALILPSVFAMDDGDVARLAAWVSGGGRLLITGDPSFDARRRPAGDDRLAALCGLKRAAALAPPGERGPRAVRVDLGAGIGPVTLQPCVRVTLAGAETLGGSDDGPVFTRFHLGRGVVDTLTDPLELSAEPADAVTLRAVYARFLADSGVSRHTVTPDEPWLHALERPTATGRLHVLFPRQELAAATVFTRAGKLTLGLRGRWPALAHVGADGAVRLVVANGEAKVGDAILFTSLGLQGVVALDGQDLRRSEEVLIAPFAPGEVRLAPRPGRFQVLVGDVVDGAFRVFERFDASGAARRVTLDADRAASLILVVRAGLEGDAIARLERIVDSPWTVPGW
jgi:hypothetical protein